MLIKSAGQSLTEQLADRFAERIGTRLLAPGARLPSVRQCAQQHGVSPSTVVAAYDRLLALGLVQARREAQTIRYSIASPAALQLMQTLYSIFCAPAPLCAPTHASTEG